MRWSVTGHLLMRMEKRKIEKHHIDEAFRNVVSRWPTPEASTCTTGRVRDGRELKIWTVGTWNDTDTMIVKSVAWKDVPDE